MFDLDKMKKTNSGVGTLTETTINFDNTELELLVTESDRSLTDKIEAYRSLMADVMKESAGDTEKVDLIAENANEDVKSKVLKILEAIRNWIVNTIKNLVARLDSIAMMNGKFLEKVEKAVKDKHSKGELKELRVEYYEYDFQAINITNLSNSLDQVMKGTGYDLTKEYTEANKESLDESVRIVQQMSKADLSMAVIEKIFKEVPNTTPSTAKLAAQKALRKGGKRKADTFSLAFIENIKRFKDAKKNIQAAYDNMKKEVEGLMKEIKAKVKDSRNLKTEDKLYYSGLIAYYNAKRKILSVAISTMSTFNNLKLQALVEQVNESRKIVAHAYRFKAVKESDEGSVNEPYNPALDQSEEADLDLEENTDITGIDDEFAEPLGESAGLTNW